MVTFEIPIKTVCSPNARMHYMKRARLVKNERAETAKAFAAYGIISQIGGLPTLVGGSYEISMTRYTSGKLMDEDNLAAVLKGVQDEITAQLGFTDDSDERLKFTRHQAKRPRGYYGVEVEISER